jgi:hypothetical protein
VREEVKGHVHVDGGHGELRKDRGSGQPREQKQKQRLGWRWTDVYG